MKTKATWKTAGLAGAWTVFGMSGLEAWEKTHSVSTAVHNILFLSFGIVFFFAPAFLFVLGTESFTTMYRLQKELGIKHMWNPEYWKEMTSAWGRMFGWFVGAVIFGIVFSRYLR